jgi:hypothetical protein
VSPLRLKCIKGWGFAELIANTGFNCRMVTLLGDFSANLSAAGLQLQDCVQFCRGLVATGQLPSSAVVFSRRQWPGIGHNPSPTIQK